MSTLEMVDLWYSTIFRMEIHLVIPCELLKVSLKVRIMTLRYKYDLELEYKGLTLEQNQTSTRVVSDRKPLGRGRLMGTVWMSDLDLLMTLK